MPLSASIIVVIMGRGDLHASSSKLSIYHLISNNNHVSVFNERMLDLFSNKIFVTRILGMHRDGRITKHSLDSGCGYFNKTSGIILECILEVNNHSKFYFLFIARNSQQSSLFNVDVLHLNVRNSCLESS